MTKGSADIAPKLFESIDAFVEAYLGRFVKPFLTQHEKFYDALNKTLRGILDKNKAKIPEWFTANWITYARTLLVIPTILLLAWDYILLPSFITLLVDFGDFLDGVVARFWLDVKKEREEAQLDSDKSSGRISPTNSDDDSFGKFWMMYLFHFSYKCN